MKSLEAKDVEDSEEEDLEDSEKEDLAGSDEEDECIPDDDKEMNKEYNQMVKADKKAKRDKANVVDKRERKGKAPDVDSVIESP